MRIALPGRLALAGGVTLLLVVLVGWSSPAPAAIKKVPSAATSLKRLLTQTTALPRNSVAAARRAALLRLARHARRVATKNPCGAVRDLTGYRRTLKLTKAKLSLRKLLRIRAKRRLAALGTSSTDASRSLLRSKRTKRCGGGVAPSRLGDTKATVLRSDENGMRLRVQLPELRFVPQEAGGQLWTKLVLPNTDAPGAPGAPGIPIASEIIAVPDGAQLEVNATKTTSYTIDGVDVYPIQPEPADQGQPLVTPAPNIFKPPFAPGPFKVDKKIYATDGLIPASPAFGKAVGQARDLNIAGLHVPAVQYNPKTDKLKVLTQVEFDVTFDGGPKTFSDAVGSPWERAQNRVAGGLLNAAVVKKIEQTIVYQPCGEELLVITNPSTRPSADTYANARRAAGYLTSVRETGAGAGQIGTTVAQIQTFIRSRLNNPTCIRPSYVTIIGDDELVPTFTSGTAGAPSDNPYAMKNDSDELPDVAIGRILGDGPAQLDAALAKIIAYETVPPAGPMLTRALIAAQFQDTDAAGEVNDGQEDRTFIQFAETVRNGLVARGVAVDRIYDDVPSTNPQRFNDGTSLPASLKKPTFAWNGSTANVSAAWNEGRFLAIHRDHGWSDGWSDPEFTTANVNALTNTNDNLPVVLSVNCSSAAYDYDETGFTQSALVKPTGGAVGVFGDTRDSPSWHNSQLALGFVDALLPSVLGGEGPATKQRTGDALIHGKLRLVGLAPPSGPGISGGDADTRFELFAWHYFGDPTMQLWGGGTAPIVFNPNLFKAIYKQLPPGPQPDPPPYLVEVTIPPELNGQPISLLRNGEVIGKAFGGDGVAQIPALFNDGLPAPGELRVAVEGDGAAPVQVGVDGVPPRLSMNCPASVPFSTQAPTTVAVSGRLDGAPAGSPVTVTFQPGVGAVTGQPTQAKVVNTTTGANGAWTASVQTTNRDEINTWTVSATSPLAGNAPSCQFPLVLTP